MNPKTVVSAALLTFVAASVLYLVNGYSGRAPADAPERLSTSEAAAENAKGVDAQVIAYYFHGTARCRTCLAIETTARDVLERELADDFESGAIRWRTVDFEQPENEHFAREFELTGASLVLVREAGGRTERWDELKQVWTLIGDEERFRAYVLDQARGYMNQS